MKPKLQYAPESPRTALEATKTACQYLPLTTPEKIAPAASEAVVRDGLASGVVSGRSRTPSLHQEHFSLIDQPWLPLDAGNRVLVSLRQVFEDSGCRAIGGSPIEKIALFKLLLAIAQAAATPEDDEEWRAMGPDGMAQRCLSYLDEWRDRFYLYGPHPFLQMPAVKAAACKSYGTVMPEIATGNSALLKHAQIERTLTDAEKAVLLVRLMGFALGGKQTDNKLVLTRGYTGKTTSGKPGPSLGKFGLLHSFVLGKNLQETLWLNLLTLQDIEQSQRFPAGVGTAPWERMPEGEDDEVARELKQSLMGRLVPLCRFCLLSDSGIHYTEGIAHPGYEDGFYDPTVAVNLAGKTPEALRAQTDKRPWRQLTALLGFLAQQKADGFSCLQLEVGVRHALQGTERFAIWSGGAQVSSRSGEQQIKGSGDFVESVVWLNSSDLGSFWFVNLQEEMQFLDRLAKKLFACVSGYYKDLSATDAKASAEKATHLFWQLCERDFQPLLDHCGATEEDAAARLRYRQRFIANAQAAYDHYCPKGTARQFDAWAHHYPALSANR